MSDVSTSNNQPQYTLDRNGLVNTLEGDPWGATIPQLRSRLLPIQPHDKVPFKVVDGGPRFKGRGPVSHAQVDRWNDRLGPCNWAVRTGDLGDGRDLTVLDVDRPYLFPEDLWSTWAVATARGYHLYGGGATRCGVRPWGEIKGAGGFVLAPGSTHHTGAIYEALPGFGHGDQLPLFPADVLDDSPPESRPEAGRTVAVSSTQTRNDVPVGVRNLTVFRAVLRAAGHERDLRGDGNRLAALARWHGEVLTQSLPGRELDAIGRSVARMSAAWSEPTDRFRAAQARRGKASGKARRSAVADRNKSIRAGHAVGFSRAELARWHKCSVWTVGRVLGTKS